MVEYHNNQTPVHDNSAATMFFVFLAIVVIVIGVIYLIPRLQGDDADSSRDLNVQVDTPDLPGDTTPDSDGTGSGSGSPEGTTDTDTQP